MRKSACACLIVGTWLPSSVALAQRDAGSSAEARTPTARQEAADLTSWTTDELIAALPLAGTEWTWNGEGSELDPVCIELGRRIAWGGLSDPQWGAVLRISGAIAVREKWPVDERLAVSMTVPDWLDLTQIRATPRVIGWERAVAGATMWGRCGTAALSQERAARYEEIGAIRPGWREVVFDVEIERGEPERFSPDNALVAWLPTGVLWRGEVRFAVQGVATIDDAVPPVDSARLTAGVTDALGAGVREGRIRTGDESRSVWYIAVDPDTGEYPELRRVGLALRVEVLRDGQVVEEGLILAERRDRFGAMNAGREGPLRLYGSRLFEKAPPEAIGDEAELARWSVRARGTSERVLRLWHAGERWAGVVEMPLGALIERERERTAARRK